MPALIIELRGVYDDHFVNVFVQSAIGEGMTRRDHADVSNQVGLVV